MSITSISFPMLSTIGPDCLNSIDGNLTPQQEFDMQHALIEMEITNQLAELGHHVGSVKVTKPLVSIPTQDAQASSAEVCHPEGWKELHADNAVDILEGANKKFTPSESWSSGSSGEISILISEIAADVISGGNFLDALLHAPGVLGNNPPASDMRTLPHTSAVTTREVEIVVTKPTTRLPRFEVYRDAPGNRATKPLAPRKLSAFNDVTNICSTKPLSVPPHRRRKIPNKAVATMKFSTSFDICDAHSQAVEGDPLKDELREANESVVDKENPTSPRVDETPAASLPSPKKFSIAFLKETIFTSIQKRYLQGGNGEPIDNTTISPERSKPPSFIPKMWISPKKETKVTSRPAMPRSVLDSPHKVVGTRIDFEANEDISDEKDKRLKALIPASAVVLPPDEHKTSHGMEGFLASIPTPQVLTHRGITIDDFDFKYKLGAGAQGSVYLAQTRDLELVQYLAVKVIAKAKRDRLINPNHLLQEQAVLKRHRGNPFIVELLASFHDSNNFYLVTPFHTGGDLQAFVDSFGRMSRSEFVFYGSELVSAIQYLHKNNIVHRDVKPANILLKADGHIAIADFGLVKEVTTSTPRSPANHERISLRRVQSCKRTLSGTISFMSPEAIWGLDSGFRGDWWSVAVTMFVFLIGTVPWDAPDFASVREAITKAPMVFHQPFGVDPNAQTFLVQMTAKDPHMRLSVAGIFSHPLFSTINWADVELCGLRPPRIPTDVAQALVDRGSGVDYGLHGGDSYDDHRKYNFVNTSLGVLEHTMVVKASQAKGRTTREPTTSRAPRSSDGRSASSVSETGEPSDSRLPFVPRFKKTRNPAHFTPRYSPLTPNRHGPPVGLGVVHDSKFSMSVLIQSSPKTDTVQPSSSHNSSFGNPILSRPHCRPARRNPVAPGASTSNWSGASPSPSPEIRNTPTWTVPSPLSNGTPKEKLFVSSVINHTTIGSNPFSTKDGSRFGCFSLSGCTDRTFRCGNSPSRGV